MNYRSKLRTLISASTCTVLIGLSSCAVNYERGNLVERLRNRGPVMLSAGNPFLAANKFLDSLTAQSVDISGFIRHRGAPAALEVRQDFLSPMVLHFLYPENGEYYVLEEASSSWVINGPFGLSDEQLSRLYPYARYSSRTRAPRLGDLPTTPPAPKRREEVVQAPAPVPTRHIPPRRPTAPPRAEPPQQIEQVVAEPPQIRLDGVDESYASIARKYPAPSAELTPRGDLVHYISFPQETISIITRWYTFDGENEREIAEINEISPSDTLQIGDALVIPASLLKNSNRLSEPAIRAIQQKIRSER